MIVIRENAVKNIEMKYKRGLLSLDTILQTPRGLRNILYCINCTNEKNTRDISIQALELIHHFIQVCKQRRYPINENINNIDIRKR